MGERWKPERGSELQMVELGRLVAAIAHEARNPLFSMSATLDAFEARFDEDDDEAAPYVRNLRCDVDRLTDLMQGLLDYGRSLVMHFTTVSVTDLISTAADDCQALASSRGITIDMSIEASVDQLNADVRQLTRALRNLIENAVLHSPEGEVVEVSARRVEEAIHISVCDRGPGISEDDRDRIFEPFFSRRSGGTGLGLAIVQKAVGGHKGTVVANTRPGGGTCLEARIPMKADRGPEGGEAR